MSVASAERKVLRCKAQLRLAYRALRAERKRAREQEYVSQLRALREADKKLERFCADHLARTPDERGLGRLPVRLRFVLCAIASGMTYNHIAAMLPKINRNRSGQLYFVKMGITKGGLSKVIDHARVELYELNRLPPP